MKTFLMARSGALGGGSRHMPEGPPGPPPTFTLTARKGVAPGAEEAAANPRARSAHLRWAERTDAPPQGAFTPDVLAPRAMMEWEAL